MSVSRLWFQFYGYVFNGEMIINLLVEVKDMKKLSIIVEMSLILIPTLGLHGCITEKPIVENTGTIVFNDIEGGFYGIIADDPVPNYATNHLDPINLSQEFRENNLRIWFKVRLRPDLNSYHMWGIMVEIIEIKKLI